MLSIHLFDLTKNHYNSYSSASIHTDTHTDTHMHTNININNLLNLQMQMHIPKIHYIYLFPLMQLNDDHIATEYFACLLTCITYMYDLVAFNHII